MTTIEIDDKTLQPVINAANAGTMYLQGLTGSPNGWLLTAPIMFTSYFDKIRSENDPYYCRPYYNYVLHDSSINSQYYRLSDSQDQDNSQFLVLNTFATKLMSATKELEPEMANVINNDFWDMYEPI